MTKTLGCVSIRKKIMLAFVLQTFDGSDAFR